MDDLVHQVLDDALGELAATIGEQAEDMEVAVPSVELVESPARHDVRGPAQMGRLAFERQPQKTVPVPETFDPSGRGIAGKPSDLEVRSFDLKWDRGKIFEGPIVVGSDVQHAPATDLRIVEGVQVLGIDTTSQPIPKPFPNLPRHARHRIFE